MLIHEDRAKSSGSSKARKIRSSYLPLQEDVFRAIADWYHFAILELTRLDNFVWDYQWIGKKLDISSVEARQATERLLRLGLLMKSGKILKLTQKSFTTTHDIPSSALRASHRQSIEMAVKNLEETPVELRDITSITIATNLNKIAEAKTLIKNFRRRLSKLLETGKKTEVYNINIQLVPVTREVNNGRD